MLLEKIDNEQPFYQIVKSKAKTHQTNKKRIKT